MSTLWSGHVFWAAVVALLLLVTQSAANDAIMVSKTKQGHWDVCLDITHIDLIPGLECWDDLAFTTLQQVPRFSEPNGNMSRELREKLAVVDIASGTLCQYTDGCMDDVASHYQILCEKESQSTHPKVLKRYRYIYNFVNRGWHTSRGHAVRAAALGVLSSIVGGTADGIFQLGRSAICASDANSNQACLSWAGGAQAIKKGIALNIISSAQGAFGNDGVSGEEYAAVFEGTAKVKKRTAIPSQSRVKRFWPFSPGNIARDVCISNRPNGCT